MTKKDRADWQKRKDAERVGFDVQPWNGMDIHSQNTLKHEFCKFALCYLLDTKGRQWDTEVQCENGRVDVFSAGPPDSKPVVYEVETDVTPQRHKEKVNQYAIGPVRDVIVIDPDDVPGDPELAIEYLDTYEVLG